MPQSPRLAGKGALWFRARWKAWGSLSLLSLPRYPWLSGHQLGVQCHWLSSPAGALKGLTCQGPGESNAFETSLHGPTVLFRCPEPSDCFFLTCFVQHSKIPHASADQTLSLDTHVQSPVSHATVFTAWLTCQGQLRPVEILQMKHAILLFASDTYSDI